MSKVPREVTRERESKAWEYRQQGWTETRIADELGIDQSTVSKMFKRLDARYLEAMRESVGQLKVSQTSQLEHIYREALEAWERSQLETTKIIVTEGKVKVDKDGGVTPLPDEIKTEREEGLGDPRYLEQARSALADIRKIWGADAPLKIDITDRIRQLAVEQGLDPDEAVQEAQRILARTR